jgi:hypothetical protein
MQFFFTETVKINKGNLSLIREIWSLIKEEKSRGIFFITDYFTPSPFLRIAYKFL